MEDRRKGEEIKRGDDGNERVGEKMMSRRNSRRRKKKKRGGLLKRRKRMSRWRRQERAGVGGDVKGGGRGRRGARHWSPNLIN